MNAPEVAILGVCNPKSNRFGTARVRSSPDVSVEPVLDHRVIDGAAGMRFTVFLANLLKDFRRITLYPSISDGLNRQAV